MKSITLALFASASLMAAGSAAAVDMPPVGKKKCASCHMVDKKLVGPAYTDVSAKYKGKKDAVAKITASVKSGGSFGWNLGKMPARGLGATDEEVAIMAKFIAGLK